MDTTREFVKPLYQSGTPRILEGIADETGIPPESLFIKAKVIDYYGILGLPKTAKMYEIKAAYYRLARLYHPDHGTQKDENKFKELVSAYEVLGSSSARHQYDLKLYDIPLADQLSQFTFVLQEVPQKDNIYAYLNKLLVLQGDKQLKIGDEISGEIHARLVPLLKHIEEEIDRLMDIENRLRRLYSGIGSEGRDLLRQREKESPSRPLTPEEKQYKERLELNRDAIEFAEHLFYSWGKITFVQKLYDTTLDHYHTEESKEIASLIGDKHLLREMFLIKYSHYIGDLPFVKTIYDLYEAKILTPSNFKKYIENINFLSGVTSRLVDAQCLTQEHFDFIIKNKASFGDISYKLKTLREINLFNDENYQLVLTRPHFSGIYIIRNMREENEFTPEMSEAMMWNASEPLKPLVHAVNEMFAYGMFLLDKDKEKAKAAMFLAIELKKDLKCFTEQSEEEKARTASTFKFNFIKKLHSQDDIMSAHRQYWKVIVANVLIALTVVGLIALGVHYAKHGQCFFAQTHREKLVQEADKIAQFCL